MAPLGKATHWLPLAVAVSRIAGSGRVGAGRWLRPGPGRITIRSSRNRFAVRLNSGVSLLGAIENFMKEATWLPMALLLMAVVLVWALSGWLLHLDQERGTFGDMFGAVNALFSGLAFATLIYTIHLQRHELRLQRIELAQTREELAGQKLQLAAQNELMRAENFESSFFRVLGVLADIVGTMDIHKSSGPELRGRDCFVFFYNNLGNRYESSPDPTNSGFEHAAIRVAYSDFYRRYQGDVGHYFRTLYNLVKLVDRSDIDDKRFYTNLIRAQLSSHELLLLFYNCLSEQGSQKFKPLIEEYALLKTLSFAELLNPHHKALYHARAYGEG